MSNPQEPTKDKMAKAPTKFSNEMEWRAVVQIVTIARFRRPLNPRNCNVHRYHVWRWRTLVNDKNEQPIDGMKCQCGCLDWSYRPAPPKVSDV